MNIELHSHEFLSLLGPSGCGKSTLLRCIAGFENYEGEIFLNGVLKTRPSKNCILVYQDFNQLFPWKTIVQNICYCLVTARGIPSMEANEIAVESLRLVHLENYRDYYPHQLSGGMKQRASIAKAIALEPDLILMDEPFASLDEITRTKLQEELLSIFGAKQRLSVILVTHSIPEAIALSSRIMVIGRGGAIMYNQHNDLMGAFEPSFPGYSELWGCLHRHLQTE